jgi:hypothetical protein
VGVQRETVGVQEETEGIYLFFPDFFFIFQKSFSLFTHSFPLFSVLSLDLSHRRRRTARRPTAANGGTAVFSGQHSPKTKTFQH